MSAKRKSYWCQVCKKQHRRTSMIGHEHEKFEDLFVKVTFPAGVGLPPETRE